MAHGGHPYQVGTQVQDKHGRVKVKVADGVDGAKWLSRARYTYLKHYKIDLTPFHRVFHIDGDIANDEPSNLTAIKFSGRRYGFQHSRVVFRPKEALQATPYVARWLAKTSKG